MNTKIINIILIAAILAVAGVIGFFAWRAFSGVAPEEQQKPIVGEKQFPAPTPITNKGKVSEDRDAALERDARAINDAVVAYAKDHKGKYPESDFKNPCAWVRYCLKGVDINTKEKIYLSSIPQTPGESADYYYRADNARKKYCITTPPLETDIGKVFQCTETACGRISAENQCQ